MKLWALISLFCVAFTLPASARDLDAKFLIKREGKVIGFHQVDVREEGGDFIVDTFIEMRVKFGPIPVFRYDHEAREIWRDGTVVSIDSETNYNGDETFVSARRDETGALYIDGSDYQGPAPSNAMPSSYWDKGLVEAEALINTQTGEIIDIDVEPLGETLAPHNASAEQYRVVGSIALDIWYDGPRWVGSQFTIDGEELVYELVEGDPQYASLEDFLD
ncbi:MAG: DUF6134 family protein [Hyphococcus sp.]